MIQSNRSYILVHIHQPSPSLNIARLWNIVLILKSKEKIIFKKKKISIILYSYKFLINWCLRPEMFEEISLCWTSQLSHRYTLFKLEKYQYFDSINVSKTNIIKILQNMIFENMRTCRWKNTNTWKLWLFSLWVCSLNDKLSWYKLSWSA